MQGQALWTRPFIAATIANLFMPAAFFLLLTVMAGYAIAAFAASDAMAGFAASSFVVGSVFGRLVAGRYLDVVGRRRLILLAMVGYIAASLAYLLAADLTLFLALRIVHGATFGLGNTALIAAVQTVIPRARRAEGNGYFGVATTISTAAGPFLAIYLAVEFGYDAVFLASAVAGVGAFVAALFFAAPEPGRASEVEPRGRGVSAFVDLGSLRVGLVIALASFAAAGVMGFIALRTEALGIPSAGGLFFLTYAAATVLCRLFLGRIQDRYGDAVVVVPMVACFVGGLMLLAVAQTPAAIAAAGLACGAGFGGLLPALLAVVVNHSPSGRVGVASSTYYLMVDAGSGIGPVLLGLVITAQGFPAMFAAGAAITAVAGAVYVYDLRRRRSPG